MNYKNKLDVYSAQIVAQYLKSKEDFLNIIQVKKLYKNLLDRMRINPIPITNEIKSLFQYLNTQQLFDDKDDEIKLDDVDIYQINYEVSYSKYLEMMENSDKRMKFKKIVYTKDDCEKYGNEIPKEVTILDGNCFWNENITKIDIPENITKIKSHCFEGCDLLSEVIMSNNVINIGKG